MYKHMNTEATDMLYIVCAAWKDHDFAGGLYSCPVGNEFIVLNSFKVWNFGYNFYLCRIFEDKTAASNYADFIERSFSNEKITHS